jgi:pimeloyl-ACP methyl ester carboxylesterase
LNVKNVQIAKLILNLSAFGSTIWFILLLLSDFVAIPGFDNKGRSFLEINFILISLFATTTSLLFFQVPSEFERGLGYITSGLLLFTLFLLLIFQRRWIGVVGSLACIWAILTNALTSFSEYLVEKGKVTEEIRLTGRVETRRTLTEWLIVTVRNVLKSVLLVYTALILLNVLLSSFDLLRVKPWGELTPVEDGAFNLHIACYGDVYNTTDDDDGKKRQPIVLLDAGHGSAEEFSEWVEELHHLNQVERYCIYDRPGYGFSDSAPSPVSLSVVSDLLAEGLRNLKIHGPFILVNHDIGGLYARVFASRNIEQIKSILLVDAWHEDLLLRNPNSKTKKNEKIPKEIAKLSTFKGFQLWIEGFFSPIGLPLQASWLFKHRGSKQRIYGKDMVHQGRYLRARLQEQISASILSYNEAVNSKNSLTDIPISVVSSDYMIKKSLNWGNWQRELTKLSGTTKEWKIVSGNHEVWRNSKGKEQLQDVLLRLLDF